MHISSRTRAFLNWEVKNIQKFLDEFEHCQNGMKRSVVLGQTGEYIIVRNYPLPDRYRPDFMDLLLVVDQYPGNAPVGIYLMNKNNEATIKQISIKFNMFRNQAHHGAQAIAGYTWVCYHYGAGSDWRFRADAPQHGDNLRKYIASFYAELS